MHSIAAMCRVLGVSAGGYSTRLKRPPSLRPQADSELDRRIAEIHRRSNATYGVARIHAELDAQGILVGRKRMVQQMTATKIRNVNRRKWLNTTVCVSVRQQTIFPTLVMSDSLQSFYVGPS